MRERHYVITQTSEVTEDTFVNEEALSSTATGATSITLAGYVRALNHNDIVGVGTTTLLLHVHDGMDTCDDCEPGQIRAKIEALNKEKVGFFVNKQPVSHTLPHSLEWGESPTPWKGGGGSPTPGIKSPTLY